MRFLKQLFYALGYGLFGSLVVLVVGYVYYLDSRPDLKIWHETLLQGEFAAAQAKDIRDLDAYRALEDRLFEQLQERIISRIEEGEQRQLGRFYNGSRVNPLSFPRNWNRTFELLPQHPVGGVLLHGLSDSPYSLRALGQMLYRKGFHVVGLRLPGHGTAPSGLLTVQWRDWAAAVRIAMRHLKERLGSEQPLYMLGYSNGAALAVEYTLAVLEGEPLPAVQGLVLLSPAIGVSKVAALAIWQSRLGSLIGMDKLAWTAIQPEFDPYKYNSFTVNAGDQIYRLTENIAQRMKQLQKPLRVRDFPRVLAFHSVVDATVAPEILIETLFSRLAAEGHELVLFDVNRSAETEELLRSDPDIFLQQLFADKQLGFNQTLITSAAADSSQLVVRYRQAGATEVFETPLGRGWPDEVFSLSHVALPFPADDPIYGSKPYRGDVYPWITLGSVALRGERNLLLFPDNYFLRLRYNPFFDYLARRVQGFCRAGQAIVPQASAPPRAEIPAPLAGRRRLRR